MCIPRPHMCETFIVWPLFIIHKKNSIYPPCPEKSVPCVEMLVNTFAIGAQERHFQVKKMAP